jgi:agmatine deiminase
MPAEWEPHAATWLAWPHQQTDWPGKFAPIPWVYGEIVRTLARYEAVNLIVSDELLAAQAGRVLQRVRADSRRLRTWQMSTNRSWVRDSGPIFAANPGGARAALDWHFNAWAKYSDWQVDDNLPGAIASALGVPVVQPTFGGRRVVLEGGSIDVNGRGLLMTTEECLLSPVQERNPGLTRADYETVLAEYLGVSQVIWLGRGIAGDDTHGHVDDLARFVNPTTVVAVVESDPADENYEPLRGNVDRLKSTTVDGGQRLEVIELPMPAPLYFRGRRLPASYANFYIANGVVIVPTFNDPKDRIALGTLAELFPDRDIIGIHCVDLVWGLGTLHCMTQQEPLLAPAG